MAIPHPDEILLRVGGAALERHGTWRKRTSRRDEILPTHTRNSVGWSKNRAGVLVPWEADVPRPHWVTDDSGDTVASALLEGQRTNELTHSEDLTHADWTAANASVTADQANGPDDATSLDEIVEDGTTGNHFVDQDVTGLTADADYALSYWAMASARDWLALFLLETAAESNRVEAYFDLTNGTTGTTRANGTGSFTRAYIEDWTDVVAGLYRCVLVGSVGNSATAVTGRLYMATADDTREYSGDGSSSIYAGFAQVEDDVGSASSYIPTTTAAATRADDFLQYPIGFSPRTIEDAGGATFYSRFQELGTALSGASVSEYWHIGGPTIGDDPRLVLFSRSAKEGGIYFGFDDGSAGGIVESETAADVVDITDDVEVRGVIFLDGSDWKIQVHVSVNGGAEVSAASATIGSSLPASWSANTLTIGADPGGSSEGFMALLDLKAALGVHSLAAIQAAL